MIFAILKKRCKGGETLRKLKEGETLVAAIFVPVVLLLLYVYAIVVLGWLGGSENIGEADIFKLLLQTVVAMIITILPMLLILRYAGEKDISDKPYIFLN